MLLPEQMVTSLLIGS